MNLLFHDVGIASSLYMTFSFGSVMLFRGCSDPFLKWSLSEYIERVRKNLIRLLSDFPVFRCWISSSGSVHRNHFKNCLGHAESAEARTKD